jgi:transposase
MILNGILWILATGAPWRDLPERYGPWSTVANRFYAWQHSGLWDQLLTDLQQAAHERGELDWSLHFVDGTMIRAHQHAAGARKGGGDQALGRSRGGFSTKLHLRAEGQGKPMVLRLTAGQRHEQTMFEPLMEAGHIKGRGRPRHPPNAWSATKATAADAFVGICAGKGSGESFHTNATSVGTGVLIERPTGNGTESSA